MFSTLRTRFGIPGVISVMALVFAMFGGAYAASNSSGGGKATASAKGKQGPRGKTGKTGPAGPAGPAGAQGAAGAQGPAGANGKDGTNGQDGLSVTNTAVNVGDATRCSKLGGAEFKVGTGTPTFACNGKDATAGGTLPSGKTETGGFAVTGTEAETFGVYAPISFNIPLAVPLEASNVHYVGTPNANCTGTVEEPTAAKGHLCVYEQSSRLAPPIISNLAGLNGASKTGAILAFGPPEEGGEALPTAVAFGSWAVTAP